MVRIGDWVTVPNSDANGTVVEINILTVKIQNFDNTFVFMPSYVMVTNAFQNWCGMVQSGVRRVKKAVYIDVNTIIRLDDATLEKMMTNEVIRKYLTEKDFQTFSDEKAKPDMCTKIGRASCRERVYVLV